MQLEKRWDWRRYCLLAALLCWTMQGGISCRKAISESQARAIASDAVAAYAKRKNLNPQEFELIRLDDSGTVVDWFYRFKSIANPDRIVTVLVGRNGGFELHHSPD